MSRTDRFLLVGGAAAMIAGLLGAVVILTGGALPAPATDPLALLASASPDDAVLSGALPPVEPASIVVDVEGAVVSPGIQRLPADARVADAIAAAGGYSPEADLEAAAMQLNLAKPLADGEQVHVPIRGVAAAPGAAVGSLGGDDGGLVDLNTATPEQLDALPGIGPVTVQKIVAARQEQPFASLDELVERGVINRGQLEEIRELATAG